MAREDLDLVPIVDDDGALAGVMTERALARRYIRESREPSELDAPTTVGAIVEVLEGELRRRRATPRSPGADLVHGDGRRRAADARSGPATSSSSATATTRSAPRSSSASALLVTSNGTHAERGDARARAPSAASPVVALAAGQLRDRAHDHAVGAVPRADGPASR